MTHYAQYIEDLKERLTQYQKMIESDAKLAADKSGIHDTKFWKKQLRWAQGRLRWNQRELERVQRLEARER